MAPLETYEKIYVKAGFLDTDHGEIPCQDCHGGDPSDPDWQTAHQGVTSDPTLKDSARVCGECHEEITASAANSLHFTLAPMKLALKKRVGESGSAHWPQVNQAFERHCGQCHTSCGQCHVSRPYYVQGGLLAGHVFLKRPPMDVTCASCHGGRVQGDFSGAFKGREADVHFEVQEMECLDCHKGAAMHADASSVKSRFEFPLRPACRDCHEDAIAGKNRPRAHKEHGDKVACQVCHGQPVKNCFDCHLGVDKEGLPYYKTGPSETLFKIGRNPSVSDDRPEKWIALRHPPVNRGLMDFYIKDAFPAFNDLETWKRDAPHNIRRITEQNRDCNNCHGRPELFLREEDVREGERIANARVIVPDELIPVPISLEKQAHVD